MKLIIGLKLKKKQMRKILNNFWFGIIVGIILPPIFSFFYYLSLFANKVDGIGNFYRLAFHKNVHSEILSVSVYFGNLIAFIIFMNLRIHKTSKGIMISTILYTIFIFILKGKDWLDL